MFFVCIVLFLSGYASNTHSDFDIEVLLLIRQQKWKKKKKKSLILQYEDITNRPNIMCLLCGLTFLFKYPA